MATPKKAPNQKLNTFVTSLLHKTGVPRDNNGLCLFVTRLVHVYHLPPEVLASALDLSLVNFNRWLADKNSNKGILNTISLWVDDLYCKGSVEVQVAVYHPDGSPCQLLTVICPGTLGKLRKVVTESLKVSGGLVPMKVLTPTHEKVFLRDDFLLADILLEYPSLLLGVTVPHYDETCEKPS